MDEDERTAWTHAAFGILSNFTVGQVTDAVAKVGGTVDHPSRIVSTICKAIADDEKGRYHHVVMTDVEPTVSLPRHDVVADAERKSLSESFSALIRKLESGVQDG